MKIISWNVNGLRAVLKKNFSEFILEQDPDVFCLQETKAKPEQVTMPLEFSQYHQFWNAAEKPGYSGTALFSKEKPVGVSFGLPGVEHDTEGRVITAEYSDVYLVTVYTPNAQSELRRLAYRLEWDRAFREYLIRLREKGKGVVFCGDLNVAHQEIDLARPKQNRRSAGFSDEERESFSALLESGFVDLFRQQNPEQEGVYTWWSYRAGARAKNVGWRIDYFGVTPDVAARSGRMVIHDQVLGSDHCPISMTLRSASGEW